MQISDNKAKKKKELNLDPSKPKKKQKWISKCSNIMRGVWHCDKLLSALSALPSRVDFECQRHGTVAQK